MLSLHLSGWLEWKCRSAAQSVGFLYRVVESLWSAPIWIFISSGWFQVILQLCGGLGHLGVECWHVVSCNVIQTLCLPHVVCLCIVM